MGLPHNYLDSGENTYPYKNIWIQRKYQKCGYIPY